MEYRKSKMSIEEKEPLVAFSTPTKFYEEITDLVWEFDISYIEAIVHYCEKKGLEIETVAGLIKQNPNLQELLSEDFEKLNYLPKRTRIPGFE
ncbi:hypothetical protein [Caulobacter phage Cr30]|uniref:hypothetical protein n=1 Tax=Caulobacter phage Cr30 TaxID=1357714 RepID=UPI0004A9B652|nr:hypothetical protein OZ74_gp194 [Caulobacter phage Cr30]AGS81149.1 hypothetical protein [Caulobacter phage Cr30]